VNGSGLIYAAIVGAWAAYLVPMWLRRQDELNEARPTERFTTAIRILSRRGAFERRSARAVAEEGAPAREPHAQADPAPARQRPAKPTAQPGAGTFGSVPAPAAEPAPDAAGGSAGAPPLAPKSVPAQAGPPAKAAVKRPPAPIRRDEGRAALLTRRRRVIASLFATFTAGAIVAGVGGLAWLWLPAVPGVLLSAYIVHLRIQERRRYEAGLRRLGRPASKSSTPVHGTSTAESRRRAKTREADDTSSPEPRTPRPTPPADNAEPRQARPRQAPPGPPIRKRERAAEEPALAEWIAELATGAGTHDRDAWDPVPVPLPTYVTAPVVPRGEVEEEPERPQIHAVPDSQPTTPPTPLFDQYAEDTRAAYGASVDSLPLYEHEWRRAVNE
jgi:hypothetical protein